MMYLPSGLAFFQDAELVARARAEFDEKRAAARIVQLIPDGVKPPIPVNPKP